MKSTVQIESEKQEFYKLEREIQGLLDDWYLSRGYAVDRSLACRKFDCMLQGRRIEEKIRDGVRDDVLIEIVQDLRTNAPGWFYTTGCHYLHYVFTEQRKLALILRFRYKKFKAWLLDEYWQKPFGKYQVSVKGWGVTLNLVVPTVDIPTELLESFDFRN
jgi:hypothetical protein